MGCDFEELLPGGASTDFLTEEHLDVPMDFTEVQKAGSRMGTGTMIVLDDRTCPVGMLWNLEHFFAQESCGWCTPCWSGLGWAERILSAMEEGQGKPGDLEKLAFQTKFLAPGQHVLRTGAWRRRATAKRVQVFPRGFRAAHSREALSVEMADGNHLH